LPSFKEQKSIPSKPKEKEGRRVPISREKRKDLLQVKGGGGGGGGLRSTGQNCL